MKSFNFLNQNNSLINYYFFDKNFTNEEIEKLIGITRKYQVIDGKVNAIIETLK